MIYQLKKGSIRLSEVKGRYWLYDDVLGMNLAMKEETEKEALLEAISYYQSRLQEMQSSYFGLKSRVESFMTGEGWKEIDQSEEDFLQSYR